jgi:hypothetical protein
MDTNREHFNITIKELLEELANIFDVLHEAELCDETGAFMQVVSLLISQTQGEELIESFCSGQEVWQDCHKKDINFLIKDFNSLFNLDFDLNKLQIPARIYIETGGKNPAVTSEDIDIIFDYLISLSRQACRYVEAKRKTQTDYLPSFTLETHKKNFLL